MYTAVVFVAFLWLRGVVTMELADCSEGWIRNGRKCYFNIMTKQSQMDSKEKCKKLGGFLAEPASQTESDFIGKITDPSLHWFIGFNDRDTEGTYIAESTGEKVCYTNWYPGQPNNFKNEDCVEMYKSEWDDVRCEAKINAVCQKNLPGFSLCPEGQKPFGKMCYSISKEKATWCEARVRCRLHGGKLVQPKTSAENKFVSTLSKEMFWIGLTDMAEEKSFVWDSELRSLGYFHPWGPRQPDNFKGVENCVHNNFVQIGKWNDLPCISKLLYVCEMYQRGMI